MSLNTLNIGSIQLDVLQKSHHHMNHGGDFESVLLGGNQYLTLATFSARQMTLP